MINLELFSCAGGMAEGFRRAGIHFDMAVDFAEDHCDSYTKNIGHRPIRMDVRDLVRMVRLGWCVEVDLFVADPPCTPWSRSGKRLGTEDERDMLVDTCELIALLKPRRYLIGNVPGLDDAVNWNVVQRVIGGLGAHGYCVADFASLDAADYGVPQHRVRPFWFGHLDGPCVRWPKPTHCDPRKLATESLFDSERLAPWITCRDALGHLTGGDLGRPVRLKWKAEADGLPNHRPSTADEPAKTITRNTHSDGCLLSVTASSKHPPSKPDAPANTVLGSDGGGSKRTLEWPWNRPATTIHSDPRIAPPGHHDENAFANASQPNAIVLSERAATILQGFPESWVFNGDTQKTRWSQIGQAMPPPLAAAVARAVVEQGDTNK